MVNQQLSSQYGNRFGVERRFWADGATTTNSTPAVWFSIPTAANRSYTVYLDFDAVQSDMSNASGGYLIQKFTRASGTTVTQQGTQIADILTGFNGQKPAISMVANSAAQTIDVTIQGVNATVISWSGDYYITNRP